MTISFSLDDNEISAEEPLGSVTIREGAKSITAKTVYLDSFASALVNAYTKSSFGPASVEVEEEGKKLTIRRERNGLSLGYANQEIFLSDAKLFEHTLRDACDRLLQSLPDSAQANRIFDPVRGFLLG